MVTKPQKIEHIETWILAKDKALIKEAAELGDQTITEFVTNAAMNAAHHVLKDADRQKNFDEAIKMYRPSLHNLKNR